MSDKASQGEIRDADIPVINTLDDQDLVFVDGFQGMLSINGVTKIGLYRLVQVLPTPPGGGASKNVQKVFVGQLAFPDVALPGIVKWLAQRVPAAKGGPDDGTK